MIYIFKIELGGIEVDKFINTCKNIRTINLLKL
jgi:hypothetical protein